MKDSPLPKKKKKKFRFFNSPFLLQTTLMMVLKLYTLRQFILFKKCTIDLFFNSVEPTNNGNTHFL